MTSKERMLIAMKNGVPDRVPCSPDISNMIPCRLTGKPFWDVLYNHEPPIWQAYIDACRHFGIDAFFFHAQPGTNPHQQFTVNTVVKSQTEERVTVDTIFTTPAGEFHEEWVFPTGDSESCPCKAFETMREALPYLKYVLSAKIDGNFEPTKAMREYIGDEFAIGGYCNTPMLPYHWLHGQLEQAVVEYYTDREVLYEYRELFHRYNVRKAELMLEGGVDFLLIESSGSLTMQSPEIFEDLQLATIQEITKMYKQAGVPTMFHSCGISQALLPILAEKTDLDGIQPLEPPPTGDINLEETKRKFGDRLVLMGNLNTPELMLRGSEKEVFDASCAAINAAKNNGGFILSTGDQCGRDTPDENIFAMVRAVEEVGGY